MSQKGGVALILLILIVVAGLAVGVYFINQQTNWFSFAGSSQIYIPKVSPAPYPSAKTSKTASPSAVYENPFETSEAAQNPFEESYQNPFDNL